MPESLSRWSQYRARKAMTCEALTPFGPLVECEKLPKMKGGTCEVAYQNPQAWLYYQSKHSAHFARIIDEAHALYPCTPTSPWLLVLYEDWVNPSDGLAINHSRSPHVFYWSFLQLGANALAHEGCWGTVTLLTKMDANLIQGGLLHVTSRVVNRFFKDPHNSRKAGVTLELYGSEKTFCILGELEMILCDEPGIKECIGCQGHAGIKPCFVCINAVLHRGMGMQDPWWLGSKYFVSIAETDIEKFRNTQHRIHSEILSGRYMVSNRP